MAVRKTKALPCAGIDLRGTKVSPLPWACQVQKERRNQDERMAKPNSREVVLPVPRGDRTEVSKEINRKQEGHEKKVEQIQLDY